MKSTSKRCNTCKKVKRLSAYNVDSRLKGGRRATCRTCRSNKYKDRKGIIIKYKESNPCKDCGNYFPFYQLEFDHVRGKKIANVSTLLRQSIKKTWEEIAKCDLVCANCHRTRTYMRRESYAID